MAVSPHAFPPRKRRPPAASFFSPHFSGLKLVQSLLLLSQEIAALEPLQFILRRNSSSAIRKSSLLAILFEDLLSGNRSRIASSAVICFEEMYIILQRIKTLIEDCSNGSRLWLLLHHQSLAASFHDLNVELSTLLDIFPLREIGLNEDVEELVILIRKQSVESGAFVDPKDEDLRRQVLRLLDQIESEIVPDHQQLAAIFERLGLRDSASCRDEIESLEDEAQNQSDEKPKHDAVALIGLTRYAKCVLYGASTPRSGGTPCRRAAAADLTIPADFRCPITLDLMRDPVVLATGQTYDRPSITSWIDSDHNTCPKTGQALAHTDLIPNRALRNLIALWCREQRIPFQAAEVNERSAGAATNKAAREAAKMTASFLLQKLSAPGVTPEAANRVIYELRALAKTDSDCRACIADAGAIPLLVRHLASGEAHPNLQVNAVTAILNLSILEANKARIMEADGALNGVVEVLRSGATWESKGNAAATIFSLSAVYAYRKRLGRKTRVLRGLVDLAREGPTASCKRDALMAIMNLAGDREVVGKLMEEGVVEAVAQELVMRWLPEEAVAVLEVVAKRGGVLAVGCLYRNRAIKKLASVLREGSERARESAAATLVCMCRKGGSEAVAEVAEVAGIERLMWELMGMGTVRAKRKAATLLRVLRRRAAGLEGDLLFPSADSATTATSTIVLPS